MTRLSNEQVLKNIDEHNAANERKISKQHEKELVEITKKYIIALKDIDAKEKLNS